MKTKWIDEEIHYDGSQLHSLYAYLNHKVLGDSVVAWVGSCNVPLEHMVDGEDKVAEEEIRGDKMLHVIVEKFNEGLSFAVAVQRLIAAITKDLVEEKQKEQASLQLKREGDDIYWGSKKLSISIATVSPASAMIHFAVNIENDGTPVETCCLSDFNIAGKDFGQELLKRVQLEIETLVEATQKVHWVR